MASSYSNFIVRYIPVGHNHSLNHFVDLHMHSRLALCRKCGAGQMSLLTNQPIRFKHLKFNGVLIFLYKLDQTPPPWIFQFFVF